MEYSLSSAINIQQTLPVNEECYHRTHTDIHYVPASILRQRGHEISGVVMRYSSLNVQRRCSYVRRCGLYLEGFLKDYLLAYIMTPVLCW